MRALNSEPHILRPSSGIQVWRLKNDCRTVELRDDVLFVVSVLRIGAAGGWI